MNAEMIQLPALDEAIVTAAQQELTTASAYRVTTPVQYNSAGEELKRIKGKAAEIEAQRVALKEPALEAGRRIDAFFRRPLDFLKAAEASIKSAMVAYSNEQDRIRQEEQRKANEAARREREKQEAAAAEARRKAEAEAAELRRKAEEEAAAGRAAEAAKLQQKADAKIERGEAKAEGLELRAATVVAPVIHRDVPKIAGFSMREVPKFEIVDEKLIPREYLAPDLVKIRAVVNALKTGANIPGVRVWMAKQPAASAATG